MSEHAVLPFNLEAEEHVVGACITPPGNAIEKVAEILEPEHITNARLRTIYSACLALHEASHPIDPVILAERMTDDLAIQRVRELAAFGYATTNVAHHAYIVREHATRRDLIDVGQKIAAFGWTPPDSIDDALGQSEQLVYDLTNKHEPGELRRIMETVPHTYEQLERPGGEITGTPTGLKELDQITAGLQPGNLIVVAARPGMGKSALALQAARHASIVNGQAAAVFSLEMSAEEINQRLLSIQARVQLMRIRTRQGLSPEDWKALYEARPVLEEAPLYVDDTVAARLVDIRARSRRLKAKRPDLALVVVDYIQLMITDGREENRNLEVARLSRGLKLLARELDVPVIALAQLNREVEKRSEKTPRLSDLRDSGALEQDADVVIFIDRDDQEEEGIANLTISKHRNGPTGATKVAWLKRRATFANLTEGH